MDERFPIFFLAVILSGFAISSIIGIIQGPAPLWTQIDGPRPGLTCFVSSKGGGLVCLDDKEEQTRTAQ